MEKIARVIEEEFPKASVHVSGGSQAANIPLESGVTSCGTSVLPKLADAISEAIFVEVCGQEREAVRRDLAPCFSATSNASLLT
eukprot:857615-Rhodomonas_salina.1